MQTLGERVREARNAKILTQVELAQRCGVLQSCISLIERGARTPSMALLEVLARELNCSAGWLVSGADESALCAEVATIPVEDIQRLIETGRAVGFDETADRVEKWLKESVGSDIPF